MLYNKQLNSIEALRAERLALKVNAHKKFKSIEAKKNKNHSETNLTNTISLLSNKLLGDSKYAELIDTVTQIALPFLAKQMVTKNAKKILLKASSEVLFGYAKWKAISILANLVTEKVKEKRASKY